MHLIGLLINGNRKSSVMNQDSVFPSGIIQEIQCQMHEERKSVKFPQSVIVWGCMSATGVRKIYFLKISINVAVYQDVLDPFRIQYTENKFREQ